MDTLKAAVFSFDAAVKLLGSGVFLFQGHNSFRFPHTVGHPKVEM